MNPAAQKSKCPARKENTSQSDPGIKPEKDGTQHQEGNRIVKQVLPTPMNQRRRKDARQAFNVMRIYSQPGKVQAGDNLQKVNDPDKAYKTQRKSESAYKCFSGLVHIRILGISWRQSG
jgi:hypothetical protein